jgi:multicomponent Na+:H+ antiporter subunit D
MLVMPTGGKAGELLGYAGAATALVAVVIALSQKDAKRLLAYHSISQIGYVVSAWGAAIHIGTDTPAGRVLMSAAFLHAFYHALFKELLFLSVGSAIDGTGERNVYALRRAGKFLRNAGERFPVTLISFTVGALAISAIPPLNGYVSKTAVTYALKGNPHIFFLTAASVGTVASFIKLSRIFWPEKKGRISFGETMSPAQIPESQKPDYRRLPLSLSMIFLGGLCVAGGVAASSVFSFVNRMISATAGFQPVSVSFFTPDNLLKTVYITAGGVLLFIVVMSKAGSKFLTIIRERPRDFQGLFVSFSLGMAALALWLLLS